MNPIKLLWPPHIWMTDEDALQVDVMIDGDADPRYQAPFMDALPKIDEAQTGKRR